MGHLTSAYAVYQVLRISLPTLVDAGRGSLRREISDRRARRFAKNICERAKIRLAIHGPRPPAQKAYVYMSNHQSHLDIPVLWSVIPAQTLRFVAKSELFQIPLWGPAMRHGEMIEVNRHNSTQAIEALKRAESLMRSGVSVWIAPEGTRSLDARLGALKKGGFHLAKAAGVDIVPMAINGTINALPPHSWAIHEDVPVDVIFGNAIPTRDRDIPELMAEVQSFFEEQVDQDLFAA